MSEFLFTSESVTEGHPDKIADQISDGVLDAVLQRRSRTAGSPARCCAPPAWWWSPARSPTDAYVDIPRIAREIVGDIGYTSSDLGFDAATCGVVVALDEQSPDIRRGVDSSYELQHAEADGDIDAQGAGDQGMMFGYACDETPERMPLAIQLAHRITARLASARKAETVPYLRPDGKAQVTVRYREERGRLMPRRSSGCWSPPSTIPTSTTRTAVRADIIEHVLHAGDPAGAVRA